MESTQVVTPSEPTATSDEFYRDVSDHDEPVDAGRPNEAQRPLPRMFRIAIYSSVVIAAVLGYLITHSVFAIACSNSGCGSVVPIAWGIAGAIVAVIGASIISVLLSRSFAEWQMMREIDATEYEHGPKTC